MPTINTKHFSLIDSNNNIILSNVSRSEIKKFARKTYYIQSKYVWKKVLIQYGFKIKNNGNRYK